MELPDFHTDRGDGKSPEQRLLAWARRELPYKTRIEVYRIMAEILVDGTPIGGSRHLDQEYMRTVIDLAKLNTGELRVTVTGAPGREIRPACESGHRLPGWELA